MGHSGKILSSCFVEPFKEPKQIASVNELTDFEIQRLIFHTSCNAVALAGSSGARVGFHFCHLGDTMSQQWQGFRSGRCASAVVEKGSLHDVFQRHVVGPAWLPSKNYLKPSSIAQQSAMWLELGAMSAVWSFKKKDVEDEIALFPQES